MQSSLETGRIHALMERLNAKNPLRVASCYETCPAQQQHQQVPPRATETCIDRSAPSRSQLDSIQVLLNRLQYNFLPQTFFSLEKNRPFYRIAGTAKEILQESLPIRCLEATFLALYLSCHLKDVERFPISFKSRANNTGLTHRHIVLGIKHKGQYGALGLSRSPLLMNKPLIYKNITELINTYAQCYQQVGHLLVSFKLGLFVTHDQYSKVIPCWRFVSLTPSAQMVTSLQDCCVKTATTVEHFELLLPVVSDQYHKLGACTTPPCGMEILSPASATTSTLGASLLSKPPSSAPGQVVEHAQQDPDEDVSDSEENQRRISCLIAMSSPFSPLLNPASDSAAAGRSKFSSRLRRTVHENPFEGTHEAAGCSGASAAVAGTPTSRRSRSVPASRRPSRNVSLSNTPSTPPAPSELLVDGESNSSEVPRQPSIGTERANAFLDKIELQPPPQRTESLFTSQIPPTEPQKPRSAQSFPHSRATNSSETQSPPTRSSVARATGTASSEKTGASTPTKISSKAHVLQEASGPKSKLLPKSASHGTLLVQL